MANVPSPCDGDVAFFTSFDFLFGRPGPAIQVVGKKVVLDELWKGVMRDGLVVGAEQPSSSIDAFEQSLEFLRLKNAFPASEDLLKFAAQPPELQLIGGVSPEDWIVSATVQNVVRPPFNFEQFNLDFVLAFLRVAQAYHSQGRVYQLVIVSETNHRQYPVDVLPTLNWARPTHSILLYRSFAWAEGGLAVVENWRGFTIRPEAPRPVPEMAPRHRYPADLVNRVSRLRRKQGSLYGQDSGSLLQETSGDFVYAFRPTLRAPPSRKTPMNIARVFPQVKCKDTRSMEQRVVGEIGGIVEASGRSVRTLRTRKPTPKATIYHEEDYEDSVTNGEDLDTDNEAEDFKGDSSAEEDDEDFDEDGMDVDGYD